MADFNAFTAGIEPGGLRTKNDIRILVCYLLDSVNAPLSDGDIAKILQEKALVNYFELSDAVSSLLQNGSIAKDAEGCYVICETGREIARQLDATLPLSIRDKALEAAVLLLARARNERENAVDITEEKQGYKVTCHISGGQEDLMAISLYVPNKKLANLVRERFYDDPSGIYELVLAALTGDRTLGEQFIQKSHDPQ